MIARSVATVAIAMAIGFALWADNAERRAAGLLDAEKRAAKAEARMDGLNNQAKLCDDTLVTCLGWQARLLRPLETIERAIMGAQ